MLGGFAGAALVFAEYWVSPIRCQREQNENAHEFASPQREIDLYEAGGRSVPGGRINKDGQGPTAGM